MDLCFDSCILIDALNGHREAADEIEGAKTRVISIVSWIEVVAGCPTDAAEEVARDLLRRFRILAITPAIAEASVQIRRRSRMKLPDAIVLATAQIAGLQLCTRDTKDFSPDDPTIRVPYQL